MSKTLKSLIINFIPRADFNTIITLFLSIISFIVLILLGSIELKGSVIYLYGLAHIFLLWTLFEIILKKSYFYGLFLFFMGVPLQNWLIGTGKSVDFSLYGFLINYSFLFVFVLFIKILNSNKKTIRKSSYKISLSFFLVLLAATISMLYTKNIYISVNGIIYGLVIPFLVYFIIISIVRRKNDIITIYEGIVLSILIYNIANYILENTIMAVSAIGEGRFAGIFGNPNFYAPILSISCLLSLYLLHHFHKTEGKYRKIYLISFSFSFYLMLLAGTRSGFISLLLGILLFLMQLPNTPKKLIIALFSIISFSLFFLYFDLVSMFQNSSFVLFRRLSLLYLDEYNNPRIKIWNDALSYIKDNLLVFRGVGFGVPMYEEIGRSTPHNSFLHLSMTIGVIGSVLYHYIIVKSISFGRLIKKNLSLNISGIIILVLLVQMNVAGYRILLYPVTEYNPSMNFLLDVIYLWVFIGISNVSNFLRD